MRTAKLPSLWFLGAALAAAACPRSTAAPEPQRGRSAACELVEDGFGPTGKVPVRAETVVSGLEVPWAIGFLPSGNRLVTERPGRVRLIERGRIAATVATIRSSSRGEGGLLGLALHPRFASNRLFYLYATVASERGDQNQVQRWRLSEDERSATFDRVILEGLAAARYHDGGRIRFGPDGMLYVAVGDATEPDTAQDPKSNSGKLLRLTPDGAVPKDNPIPGRPLFLLGLRNPQGFDWRGRDLLYVVDHGPSGELGRRGHDELSLASAGDNLGWPSVYGCESKRGLVSPLLVWREAAPPGGAVWYTGDAIPEWRNSLLIATLRSKHLHRVVFASEDPRRILSHEIYFAGEPPRSLGRLREVAVSPEGEILLTTSNCDGRGDCPPEKDKIVRVVK